jgi:hypothetical protein
MSSQGCGEQQQTEWTVPDMDRVEPQANRPAIGNNRGENSRPGGAQQGKAASEEPFATR